MLNNQTSLRGKLARHLITGMTSSRLIGNKIQQGEHFTKVVELPWQCPKGYLHELIIKEFYTMEFFKREDSESQNVILQLHGGGYIGQLRNCHRNMAKLYCDYGEGTSVLMVDYRVAPENPYPAALEDALSAYDWLLEQGYSEDQIIIAGDSAGGGLALALCLYLKDHHRVLPQGIIAMSPWTDMTASGGSYTFNYERDPLFGNTRESALYKRDYVGEADMKHPYISPVFGDYKGFPPLLIQVGSYEMLLSDSLLVAKKARESGVNVTFQVYKGMFHDFQMAGELIPESKNAWQAVGQFMGMVFKFY